MSRFFKIVSIVLVLILCFGFCLLFSACSDSNPSNEANETITVQDMLGISVEVKKNPTKVACVSRTTYDLLIAFGLGDVIDGVYKTVLQNEWTSVFYPDSVNHYSYAYLENYETFISRGVDLVFSPEGYIADGLREHGITAMTVCLYGNPSFDNYVFYFADLVKQLWGEREGVNEKVDAWKQSFSDAQAAINTELDKHTITPRKLYYVRGDKNNGIGYTDTGKSFVEYAYKFLRCDYVGNRFLINDKPNNRPSAEEIVNVNPDVFVVGGIYQKTLINTLKTTEPYINLTAVKNNQIYNIPIGFTMFEQISAFSPVFLYDQANKLYPSYFNFDVAEYTKTLSKQFFNLELTDEQVNNMLNGLSKDGNELA